MGAAFSVLFHRPPQLALALPPETIGDMSFGTCESAVGVIVRLWGRR